MMTSHIFQNLSARKLSEMNRDDSDPDPVYGFKRDLIRLIGNLCHKNKGNQDLVIFFKNFNRPRLKTNIDLISFFLFMRQLSFGEFPARAMVHMALYLSQSCH